MIQSEKYRAPFSLPGRLVEKSFLTLIFFVGVALYVAVVLFLSDSISESPLATATATAAAVVLIAGLWLLAKRPIYGLYAFIAVMPLANLNWVTTAFTISPPNVVLIASAAAAMVALFRQRSPSSPYRARYYLLIFGWLLLATVLSAMLAQYSEGTFRFLVTRVGYAITFFVPLLLIKDVHRLATCFRVLIVVAVASAILSIVGGFYPSLFPDQIVHCNEPLLPLLNTPRCVAFNLSFHPFGTLLLTALGALGFELKNPGTLNLRRSLCWIGVFFLLFGLVIAQVRGAWVAIIVTVPVLFLLDRMPKTGFNRVAFWAAGIVVLLVLAPLVWSFVLQPIVALRSDNITIRLQEYRFALDMFSSHALFGVGPIDDRFLALAPLGMPAVDNLFIMELAASGIFGFIPILLLWGGAFRSAFQTSARWPNSVLARWGVLCGGCLLLQFSSLQSYIAIGEKTPWLVMGCIAALGNLSRHERLSPHREAESL